MRGMNGSTGRTLAGHQHLHQSIRDVLSTPLGSRCMRRDYGSRLFELVDAPLNPQTLIAMYSAVAEALYRWEPRIRVSRVSIASAGPGRVEITLEGEYLPNGQPLRLEGIVV